MDLYISLNGNWIWIPILLVIYLFIFFRYIKSTEYFLFKHNCLPSYFLITCSASSLIASFGSWPLALIFFIESHLILKLQKKYTK